MKTVVNKQNLITTLKKNRDDHQRLYKDAVKGYIKAARESLNKKLDELEKQKENADIYISISKPIDNTNTFNTAIQMFEWSVEDNIELNEKEFRNYVLDEWDWKASWFSTNKFYSNEVAVSGTSLGF